MKYNININQKAVVESGLDIDIVDCAIIDYIHSFLLSKKIIKILVEGREFFRIQYEHFIANMPLLGIKNKHALRKRIDKLVDLGILDKYLLNNNSTYFRLGEKIGVLFFDTEGEGKGQGGCTQGYRGVVPKGTGINNNIINNNISSKEDTKSGDFDTQLDLLGDFLDNKPEVEPTPRADITNLIQEIKDECKKVGKAYDSTNDRHFAKHIISAKQYGEFCSTIGMDRISFAKMILRDSIDMKYWKGPCTGPMLIYKHYAGVYNKKTEGKGKTGVQNTHSKDYTEGLENIKPLLL